MDVTFVETVPTPVYALFTPTSPLVPDVDGATFDDDELTGTAKLSYFWNDSIMTYICTVGVTNPAAPTSIGSALLPAHRCCSIRKLRTPTSSG